MNYIDDKQTHIIEAREIHIAKLLPLIKERVSKYGNTDIRDYLTENRIKEILESDPKNLLNLNVNFYENTPNFSAIEFKEDFLRIANDKKKNSRTQADIEIFERYENLHIEVKKIFNYTDWFVQKREKRYNAYDLAEKLDISTCTYCNRLYTKTVIRSKDKITRPEFDHWYPKSKYPLLALSFYNLIPSCHICNSSVKGSVDFDTVNYIHPYIDSEINMQFSYKYTDNLSNPKFKIHFDGDKNGKTRKTVEAFKLEAIYETHEDEMMDMLKIRHNYSRNYLEILNALLEGTEISTEEIYRLAFGTYLDEDSFNKRPLSRMKRDILKELGIV